MAENNKLPDYVTILYSASESEIPSIKVPFWIMISFGFLIILHVVIGLLLDEHIGTIVFVALTVGLYISIFKGFHKKQLPAQFSYNIMVDEKHGCLMLGLMQKGWLTTSYRWQFHLLHDLSAIEAKRSANRVLLMFKEHDTCHKILLANADVTKKTMAKIKEIRSKPRSNHSVTKCYSMSKDFDDLFQK